MNRATKAGLHLAKSCSSSSSTSSPAASRLERLLPRSGLPGESTASAEVRSGRSSPAPSALLGRRTPAALPFPSAASSATSSRSRPPLEAPAASFAAVPQKALLRAQLAQSRSFPRRSWGCAATHGAPRPWRQQASTFATLNPTPESPPPPGTPSGGSSSSQAGEKKSSEGMSGTRVAWIILQGVFIWSPALMFWAVMVSGTPIVDFRTDEELEDDEHEAQRMERFFDIASASASEDYVDEWDLKEKALSVIFEKLLKSSRFVAALQGESGSHQDADVEASFVFPPENYAGPASLDYLAGSPGHHSWTPRLTIAHANGSIALVSTTFEFVEGGKDRPAKWSCTSLRADLVMRSTGEATCEPICELRGPTPHGVQYMRI